MKHRPVLTVLFTALMLIANYQSYAQRHKPDQFEYKGNGRFNSKTKIAEAFFNADNTVYQGSPEAIALKFLEKHKSEFGFSKVSDLRFLQIVQSPVGKHVSFLQTFKGIPVYGSETVVTINKRNQVVTAANGCIPISTLKEAVASISKDNSIDLAKNNLKLKDQYLKAQPNAELYIYPDSLYNLHLAWKVMIQAENPKGTWQILVNAGSGEILEKKDLRMKSDDGQGRVFKPDPVAALWNSSLRDMNDADYPALQAAYKIVSLPYLDSPVNGQYRLWGKYARSEDLDFPFYQTSRNTSPSFLYKRNQPGFEETNIYYFLTTQREYFESLGFSPTWNGNSYIRFDAHGTIEDNSWWDPYGQYLIFGDGSIDDAEDQDVILHEYAHAVHDALMAGIGIAGNNERSISEGTGDFMALSYRMTLSMFLPDKIFPWDGNGESWAGRTLNAFYYYPRDWIAYYDYYHSGTLWASTMMDIQDYGDIGRDIIHTLILSAFPFANNWTMIPDHIYYMFRSDYDLYAGVHLKSLGQGLYERGMFNEGPKDKSTGIATHPNNLLSGNITSSTTWNGIKWVNGTVYIKNGVTATNYAFLFIGENQKIVIERGGVLKLGGECIKYPNATIQVNPGGTLYHLNMNWKENSFADNNDPGKNEPSGLVPTDYILMGNFPNPFNPSTFISYGLPEESSVDLAIYDIVGRKVRSFRMDAQTAGYHDIEWDATDESGRKVTSGIYLYRIEMRSLRSSGFSGKTGKMVLTK